MMDIYNRPDPETVYKALQERDKTSQEKLIQHYYGLVRYITHQRLHGSVFSGNMFEPDDIIQEVEEKIAILMNKFNI